MKFPLRANPFPPLVLTSEDAIQLAAVAQAIVRNTVEEYNEYLTVHNGDVDKSRWKKIKQRENVRVYRKHGAPPGIECNEIAPILASGSINGRLDDVMYGMISPTTEAMHVKTAYMEDGFIDSAVLAQITKPSEHDPFRELSVKWFVKGNPLPISAIMRVRDILYIDSSGFAQTPNGERIGYHLKHSVEIPGVRELSEFSLVRAMLSFCYIFRQRSPSSVEVFVRGIIDPMGDASAALIAARAAEVTVSVSRSSYCAEMKKLTRVLQCSRHWSSSLSLSSSTPSGRGGGQCDSSSTSTDDSARSTDEKQQQQLPCEQRCQSLSSKLQRSLVPSPKAKSCAVCGVQVCSHCRVPKTVYVPSGSAKELAAVATEVCTLCMARIVKSSSAAFAALDARAGNGEAVDYAQALV